MSDKLEDGECRESYEREKRKIEERERVVKEKRKDVREARETRE